ncbi:ribonuclease H family protein [Ferrimonas marina]|uniref:ribonuclease H n=1 Tax=Ferrimonas marina TaxID=299255 RepID=A0A1M5X3Y9_9GAMM|nr:ribonuclease H family protein [Ferrimonas marina]SHH94322.1 ribonuclease HI [Ferrimonas marina]
MAKKFYVVWRGHKTGIFTDWPQTQAAVSGFSGAKYKAYPSREAAMAALKQGHAAALGATAKAASKPAANTASKPANTAALPDSEVAIYCDGACDPNPGQAGTGVALYRQGQAAELWYGLYNPMGTNNTAELNGLHQALLLAQQERQSGRSVTVLCDSMYAINCIKVWADGWQKRGWKRAGGEIQNLAQIQTIHALWQQLKHQVSLEHVKGHAGIEGNELADRMSVYAVTEKQPDFVALPTPFDLDEILAMRAG